MKIYFQENGIQTASRRKSKYSFYKCSCSSSRYKYQPILHDAPKIRSLRLFGLILQALYVRGISCHIFSFAEFFLLCSEVILVKERSFLQQSTPKKKHCDDMDRVNETSAEMASKMRSSCIGFSTPTKDDENSQQISNKNTTASTHRYRRNIQPKINLDQDSLVKKNEEIYKSLFEDDLSELQQENKTTLQTSENQTVSKFMMTTSIIMEEAGENDENANPNLPSMLIKKSQISVNGGERNPSKTSLSGQSILAQKTSQNPKENLLREIDKIRISRSQTSSSTVFTEGEVTIFSSRRRSSLQESLLANTLHKKKKTCCACSLI